MSCGYQGYEFGGGYLDSICIDGYLWDADSCDEPGGGLTHGGEWACPHCNTERFLEDALREAKEGSCGKSMFTPWCAATQWEGYLRKAMKEQPGKTKAFLRTVAPFTTCDWPDRKAVEEGRASWENTIDRQWPWSFTP